MKPLQSLRVRPILLIALLIAAVALMIMMRQCSTPVPFAATDNGPSGGDTIDVAIEYAPMAMYRQNDTMGGFTYDMLRIIAADSMVFKFHPVASASAARRGLASGQYAMIATDMPATLDSDSSVRYSVPVFLDRQVLVQRVDSATGKGSVNSSLDLGGKHITVAANSPMQHRLENLAAEIGDSIHIMPDATHGSEQLFLMVAVGDIPYAVVNERLARLMTPRYPHVDISANVSFTQFQSWIFSAGNTALAARIDSAIMRFKRTPEYSLLLKRYQ